MPVSIPNVCSQCDRAIRAFLISQGCGSAEDINVAYSVSTNTYPNTVVKSISSTHLVENSGLERIQVQLQFKQTAAIDPGEPNPEFTRVQLDLRVGQSLAAMLQTSDNYTLDATAALITVAGQALAVSDGSPAGNQSALNNADMAQFTMQHLYYKGAARGQPDDDNASWVEVRNFECDCDPLAIS